MSDPQRRHVRVRRSPKIGVFLAFGAVLGALAAVVLVNVTPPDATVPKVQAIGFLILLLAPIGALLAGVVALLLDRVAERRAREVEVELVQERRARGQEAPSARTEGPEETVPEDTQPPAAQAPAPDAVATDERQAQQP